MKAGGCPRVTCEVCFCHWDWNRVQDTQLLRAGDGSDAPFKPLPMTWPDRQRQLFLGTCLAVSGASTWLAYSVLGMAAWSIPVVAGTELTLFLASEVRSRGNTWVSSHFGLLVGLLGLVIGVKGVALAAELATSNAATWLTPYVWWHIPKVLGYASNAIRWGSNGLCALGLSFCGAVSIGEWVPPVYRVLLRL